MTEEAEASLRQSHDFESEWGVNDWWHSRRHPWHRAAFGGRLRSDLGRARDPSRIEGAKGQRHWPCLSGRIRDSDASGERPTKLSSDQSLSWRAARPCSRSTLCSVPRLARTARPTALALDMAGEPNMTSPNTGRIGVEMFGEIEDLCQCRLVQRSAAQHRPDAILQTWRRRRRRRGGRRQASDDDNSKDNNPEPAEMEFSMNVGVQFGLTDVTSDSALKFQGSLAF